MQARRWGTLVFVLGTVAVAAVTALLLVILRPPVEDSVVGLTVAVILLAGSLLHEALARRSSERKQLERLARMRQAYEDLVELMVRTRAETAKAPAVTPQSESPPEPLTPPPPPPPLPLRSPKPSPPGDGGMAAIVRAAIAEERVEFHLQPVVGLPSRKHRGYEVLSRIRQTDGSVLEAERYLTIADRERLLLGIDSLMLDQVSLLIEETNRRHHTVLFFCNVSVETLGNPEFRARFAESDDAALSLRTKLVLELSQRDFAIALATQAEVIGELGRAGFCFSMDQVEHFDMGVDSLIDHQVRFVKLNRAFFLDAKWRTAITDLHRRLAAQRIEVIVERVETEAQLHELEAFGLELGQGYLFGTPRPSRRQI